MSALFLLMKRVLIFFTLIFAVFFFSSYLIFAANPSAGFYLMPSRVFQFAAGMLVALVQLRVADEKLLSMPVVSSLFTTVGAAAFLASCIFADGRSYDFWVAAALPTFGAVMMLAGINSPISQISFGGAVQHYFGTRSYSIYLVHWPMIVFATTVFGADPSVVDNLLLAAASIIVAEALYRGVEQVFRLNSGIAEQGRQLRTTGVFFLLPFTLFACFAVFESSASRVISRFETVVATSASPERNNDRAVQWFEVLLPALWAERSRLGWRDLGCVLQPEQTFEEFNAAECVEFDGQDKLLILADSFGPETFIMLKEALPDRPLALAAGAGCLPSFPPPVEQLRSAREGCLNLNQQRFEWIDREDVAAIVLSTNWSRWNARQITTTFEALRGSGKPVLVFGARPIFSRPVPSILASAVGGADLRSHLSFDPARSEALVGELAAEFGDQFLVVPLAERTCSFECSAFTPSGSLAYIDTSHITAGFARWLGQDLASEMGELIRVHLNQGGSGFQ